MAYLRNITTGEIIAENVRFADGWWDRFAGLIPRKNVGPDEGLWFRDCWVIHTLLMRAKIDVIFLDHEQRVLRTLESVRANKPALGLFGARSVVELGAGALQARDVLAGDKLGLQ